jgi:hypothetical protein
LKRQLANSFLGADIFYACLRAGENSTFSFSPAHFTILKGHNSIINFPPRFFPLSPTGTHTRIYTFVRESTHIHTYIYIWKAKGGGIRSFSFFILCSARGRALDAGVVFRGAFWRHLSEQSLTPAAAQTPATTTSRSPVAKLNLLLSWRQTHKRRARACRRWRKA